LSSQSSTPPPIFYNQRRVVVVRNQQQWVALIGIPLDAHLGQHTLIDQQTATSYSFQVVNKIYKTQRLKFKGKGQAILKPEDLQRIQREAEIVKAILATPWRPTASPLWPLVQPVHGRISGTYGLRRYINGEPRKPHSGIDIAVPLGTAVSASADGIVVNTGNYFFSGNTIFLDHGQGMITMYGHLSSIAVQEGQTVSGGQIIGRVGKTGRATGPHLHWAVSVNNTMVDPMLFVTR
jgi:murein DD-endopeptidase MepM/ murein hydrolase activator NlpD